MYSAMREISIRFARNSIVGCTMVDMAGVDDVGKTGMLLPHRKSVWRGLRTKLPRTFKSIFGID